MVLRKTFFFALLCVSLSVLGQTGSATYLRHTPNEYMSFLSSFSGLAHPQVAGGSSTATPVDSPKPFVMANPGNFSKSTSYLGITANINGCDPAALYGGFQNNGRDKFTYTGGITGCVTGDTSGNNHEIIAVQGFATSKHAASEPVGGSFYGIAAGQDGVHAFGTNPLVADAHGSNKNISLTGEEIDVQPSNGPSSYYAVNGLFIRLFNPYNAGGTYRGQAIVIGAGTSSPSVPAYWSEGLTFFPGSISPSGVAINVNALGKATATSNYDCPRLLNAYEAYWNGSANAFEGWSMQCNIASSGTNPASDYFRILHNSGTSPAGQAHYFDLTHGISLQLDGAESGSAVISASTTGGSLNLGSANATVTAKGALLVASCTGCGLPGALFSMATRPLPTCGSESNGEQEVVNDATNPTYMGSYKSGGAITAPVICSYNGKSYSWVTH